MLEQENIVPDECKTIRLFINLNIWIVKKSEMECHPAIIQRIWLFN